jgi:hypothetical protein
MNSKNIIKVVPIPNNNFTKNEITITNPINDNKFDFTHKGTYIVSSSSYANNDTQVYNAFNSLSNKYWQSNYNGNKDYSKDPYTNSINNLINSSFFGIGNNTITNIEYSNVKDGNNKPIRKTINGEWIQIKIPDNFSNDIYLYSYSILTPKPTDRVKTFPTRFMVVGSNDGKIWEYIDNQNLYPIDTSVQRPIVFNINSPFKYSYYRLIIIEMPPKNRVVRISQWALNFLPYSAINKEAFSNLNTLTNNTHYDDSVFNNNLKYLSYNTSNPVINKEENNLPIESSNGLKNDIVLPIICLSVLAISIIFYNKKNK